MLISTNNKNPLTNFERNHWNHQKPQIFIGLKFSLKCMKNEIKPKKKGQNSLSGSRWSKPLRKIKGKRQKNLSLNLDRSKRERKAFWNFWNSEEHVRISCFKKLSNRFLIDQKINSIDRKLHSIDPAAIEHRLSQADSNQIFNRNFDRSSNKFDRSKSGKIKFLKNRAF